MIVKIAVILTLFLSNLARANNSFKSTMLAIDRNYYSYNIKQLKSLLNSELSQFGINELWQNYVKALIHYRLITKNLAQGNKKLVDDYLDEALLLLGKYKNSENKAEIEALRASLLGIKISVKPFPRGIILEEKLENAQEFSLENAKENMRVQLFLGISLFNKPRLFGGSKKKAAIAFEKALFLLQNNTTPYWGEIDVKYWYSISLIEQEKYDEALIYIKELLVEFPQNKSFIKLLENINKKTSDNINPAA